MTSPEMIAVWIKLIDVSFTFASGAALMLVIRLISRDVIQYLNHRLDVLGKDAYLFPPASRYTMTDEGRLTVRVEAVPDSSAEVDPCGRSVTRGVEGKTTVTR